MNIAALQAIAGQSVQTTSNGVQADPASSGTFGSVFGSIVSAGTAVVAPVQQQLAGQVPDESILAIFNATTVEELELVLQELVGDEDTGQLSSLTNLGNLEELASLLEIEPEQLMESILSLLEKAGLSEEELLEVTYSNDLWVMLNAIDKVAPQFFQQLSDALEGKGDLPKQQAVNLLALLKTVELVAPKTDLVLKQEQQVFTLQTNLVAASEQFEKVLQVSQAGKPSTIPLTASTHAVQFIVQSETAGQAMTDDGAAKNSAATTNTTGVPVDEALVKASSETTAPTVTPKESAQQAISSVAGHVAVARGEFSPTATPTTTSAQNEELIREMQNIFKRSGLGQTGGTNRLLIKLYPEHLGQVRIELLQVNGVMTARILASTALGKEMLDSQLNQLRQAFLQQNLQVERIDVSQTLQDTSRNDREQAFNQHFKKQGQEAEQQQQQDDEEEMSFAEYMIDLEV